MENHIIIGAKITDKVQQSLDKCLPAYHYYFKDNNPDFLQVVRVEGERVIGKTLTPGLPVSKLADYSENVLSILKKVCPEYNWGESDIRVYAQTLIG